MESFGRRCLDGALGDFEEVAGFSGEDVLVKRLTYGVECIGYPLSGFTIYLFITLTILLMFS